MANSIDDLERAVEELIEDAKWADTHLTDHEAMAALARELVLRLRAGIAECERQRSLRGQHDQVTDALDVVLAKLTGATREEQSRGTT